jgi:hypothetical protein
MEGLDCFALYKLRLQPVGGVARNDGQGQRQRPAKNKQQYFGPLHRNEEHLLKYKSSTLRHEFKYIINYNEYEYLKARISGIMYRDAHSGINGYHIRSLYFDDMYGSALAEKESGVMFRQKYRVRIYDKSDKVIKLERKEKFGEFINKVGLSLSKDEFYNLIAGDTGDISFLLKSGNKMAGEMYGRIRALRLAPAVIVDYRRDVFVAEEGNVRITFDKELQAGIDTPDIFGDIHIVNALNPQLMVLEVKYDDFLPKHIKNALQITSHKREAVSKYVYCRLAQFQHNPQIQYLIK